MLGDTHTVSAGDDACEARQAVGTSCELMQRQRQRQEVKMPCCSYAVSSSDENVNYQCDLDGCRSLCCGRAGLARVRGGKGSHDRDPVADRKLTVSARARPAKPSDPASWVIELTSTAQAMCQSARRTAPPSKGPATGRSCIARWPYEHIGDGDSTYPAVIQTPGHPTQSHLQVLS